MKKKATKKRPVAQKSKDYSHVVIGYSLVIFAVVCLFVIVTVTYLRFSHAGVLGVSTLAEDSNTSSGKDREGGNEETTPQNEQEHQEGPSQENGFRQGPPPTGAPAHFDNRKKNIHIEQRGKEGFMFKEGSIGARTKFPLSINP